VIQLHGVGEQWLQKLILSYVVVTKDIEIDACGIKG
jgi:hypothetical protein